VFEKPVIVIARGEPKPKRSEVVAKRSRSEAKLRAKRSNLSKAKQSEEQSDEAGSDRSNLIFTSCNKGFSSFRIRINLRNESVKKSILKHETEAVVLKEQSPTD
jgi:hypothetical protein